MIFGFSQTKETNIMFHDSFTNTTLSNTSPYSEDLTDRTPETGTGWNFIAQYPDSGGAQIYLHNLTFVDEVTNNIGGSSDYEMYEADATYPDADYKITVNGAPDSSDDTTHLLLRMTDEDNFYAFEYITSGECVIYKNVSGTITAITTEASCTPAQVVEFEVVGTTLTATSVISDTELATGTDSAISTTGKAGFAFGAVRMSADDISSQSITDFYVHNLGAAPASAVRRHVMVY